MSQIQASPTLQVMKRAKELASQGINVIDFGPGEPDFVTPDHIREAGKAAIDDGFTRYTDSSGIVELRQAVATTYNQRYGTAFTPAQVIVGTGGKQELFNLVMALVGPGDEVVIPSPYWVSFPPQVVLAGGVPVYAELSEEDGFRPTAEAIERVLTDRSRVLILNSPSNPTGAVIRSEEMAKIVALCREHNIVIISDETYDFFVYDGETHVSAASWYEQNPETIVVVNSMSKTYAMTGWRIGFALGHPDLIRTIGKIQSHSTSNPCSIAQRAALHGLQSGSQDIAVMLQAYVKRRAWLLEALGEVPGLTCHRPGGAFYVFPRVRDLYGRGGISDSTSLSTWLLDQARVAVVPGAAFGNDDYIRISYATSMENLREGVRRIREAVEAL